MVDLNEITGAPTKRFFVSMLPRDIELDDAILDLVDNSVDGAMRLRRDRLAESRPFEGYRCDLILGPDRFELVDNCGGIPDDYLESAFRLGRPGVDLDADLPTIGMYGVGMKRAIFKMARDAVVTSRSKDRAVRVHYDPEWLNPDSDDWALNIEEIGDRHRDHGVTISISALIDEVSRRFGNDMFLDALREKLGQHFAYVMGRGFQIIVNGTAIVPDTV